MPQLLWGKAEGFPDHAWQSWTCADPDEAKYDKYRRQKTHPRDWELKVQSSIRTLRSVWPGHTLGIGVNPGALRMEEDGSYSVDTKDVLALSYFGLGSDGDWLLLLIARSCAARGRELGRETIRAALNSMRRQMDGDLERSDASSDVFARIDPRNDRSKRAFQMEGFEHLGFQDTLELWGREL